MTVTFLRLRILHLPAKHSGCFPWHSTPKWNTDAFVFFWVKFESDFPDLVCMHALISKLIFKPCFLCPMYFSILLALEHCKCEQKIALVLEKLMKSHGKERF